MKVGLTFFIVISLTVPILATKRDEPKFDMPGIPGFGLHECGCGGTFWQAGRPKLQKTIDRNSPNQQGVKWVYSFLYICDKCNWHINLSLPAIPVE